MRNSGFGSLHHNIIGQSNESLLGYQNSSINHCCFHLLNYFISFIIGVFCFLPPTRGQTVVSGKLLDEARQGIGNVLVSYKTVDNAVILGFVKSDSVGMFKLEIKPMSDDSIQLDLNHLAYKRKVVIIPNATETYTYTLQDDIRQIEEVKVKEIPVFRSKDTVVYSVDAFTSKHDRVIVDIIRKLPGIELQGDRILYQGKPIQKYMVNNLDLMEGKYAMINNNLPVGAVTKVQIIENDQPIKVLDSTVFSDQASLNLELKRFTTTGTGKLGVGAQPALWDVNLTPISLGKTFQMLNSIQTNNIGYDAAKGLQSLYNRSGSYGFGGRGNVEDGPRFIFIREVSSPGFDENKWLDNKVFLANTSFLKKLKRGMELKGSLSYHTDTRKQQGFTATQFFTSDTVIINTEDIGNRLRLNALDAGGVLESNKKTGYLRNFIKYHKRWDTDFGNLMFNNETHIAQRKSYNDEAFLNSLSIARYLGKQLVNITSNIEWHNTPQRLTVSPGQFEDFLNQGKAFDKMGQLVQFKGLDWANQLGFTKKIERWRFRPSLTFNYARQSLDSKIEIEQKGQSIRLEGEYLNEIINSRGQLGLNVVTGWETPKWKFNLSAPFDVFYFDAEQQGNKILDKAVRSTFNPSASMTYMINTDNQWSVNLSGGNQYGSLRDLYGGFIITHYRSMQRYDTRLLRVKNFRSGLSYQYRNIVRATFANLDYNYSRERRDYIFTTIVDSLGRTNTAINDTDSRNFTHSFSGGASRFLPSIKTVVKLNGTIDLRHSDYLLNGVMSTQRSRSYGGGMEVISNITTFLSGDYKTTAGQFINYFAGGRRNNVFYNNHYLNFFIIPFNKHTLGIKNAFYHLNIPERKNQYFLEMAYRYHIDRWSADIELTAINILNNNRYVQQVSSNFELAQSTFYLRPRQVLLSVRFKF